MSRLVRRFEVLLPLRFNDGSPVPDAAREPVLSSLTPLRSTGIEYPRTAGPTRRSQPDNICTEKRQCQVAAMGYSDFLFAQPSFLEGVARVVDVGGSLNRYNRMPTAQEADSLAMWADWAAVGSEIASAAVQFKNQVRPELVSVEKK